MSIFKIVNELKRIAINTETVNMASFGDLKLYDNKSTIKYPYVNIDVVNTRVNNNAVNYVFRLYVNDRNEPYIAYNKCELILNNIIQTYDLEIRNYVINYFNLDFQDVVNGVWTDITITVPMKYNCLSVVGDDNFITNDAGDLIATEDVPDLVIEE